MAGSQEEHIILVGGRDARDKRPAIVLTVCKDRKPDLRVARFSLLLLFSTSPFDAGHPDVIGKGKGRDGRQQAVARADPPARQMPV